MVIYSAGGRSVEEVGQKCKRSVEEVQGRRVEEVGQTCRGSGADV